MNNLSIQERLRLIREGTLDEQSPDQNTDIKDDYTQDIDTDDFIAESYIADINFITEMTADYLIESDIQKDGFIERIKKIIAWIKNKIIQFVKFIKEKFNNKKRNIKESLDKIKDKFSKNKYSGVTVEIYEKAFNMPTLQPLVDKIYNDVAKSINEILEAKYKHQLKLINSKLVTGTSEDVVKEYSKRRPFLDTYFGKKISVPIEKITFGQVTDFFNYIWNQIDYATSKLEKITNEIDALNRQLEDVLKDETVLDESKELLSLKVSLVGKVSSNAIHLYNNIISTLDHVENVMTKAVNVIKANS